MNCDGPQCHVETHRCNGDSCKTDEISCVTIDCVNIANPYNIMSCIKAEAEDYMNTTEESERNAVDFFRKKANKINRCFGNARLCFRLMNDILSNLKTQSEYLPKYDLTMYLTYVKQKYLTTSNSSHLEKDLEISPNTIFFIPFYYENHTENHTPSVQKLHYIFFHFNVHIFDTENMKKYGTNKKNHYLFTAKSKSYTCQNIVSDDTFTIYTFDEDLNSLKQVERCFRESKFEQFFDYDRTNNTVTWTSNSQPPETYTNIEVLVMKCDDHLENCSFPHPRNKTLNPEIVNISNTRQLLEQSWVDTKSFATTGELLPHGRYKFQSTNEGVRIVSVDSTVTYYRLISEKNASTHSTHKSASAYDSISKMRFATEKPTHIYQFDITQINNVKKHMDGSHVDDIYNFTKEVNNEIDKIIPILTTSMKKPPAQQGNSVWSSLSSFLKGKTCTYLDQKDEDFTISPVESSDPVCGLFVDEDLFLEIERDDVSELKYAFCMRTQKDINSKKLFLTSGNAMILTFDDNNMITCNHLRYREVSSFDMSLQGAKDLLNKIFDILNTLSGVLQIAKVFMLGLVQLRTFSYLLYNICKKSVWETSFVTLTAFNMLDYLLHSTSRMYFNILSFQTDSVPDDAIILCRGSMNYNEQPKIIKTIHNVLRDQNPVIEGNDVYEFVQFLKTYSSGKEWRLLYVEYSNQPSIIDDDDYFIPQGDGSLEDENFDIDKFAKDLIVKQQHVNRAWGHLRNGIDIGTVHNSLRELIHRKFEESMLNFTFTDNESVGTTLNLTDNDLIAAGLHIWVNSKSYIRIVREGKIYYWVPIQQTDIRLSQSIFSMRGISFDINKIHNPELDNNIDLVVVKKGEASESLTKIDEREHHKIDVSTAIVVLQLVNSINSIITRLVKKGVCLSQNLQVNTNASTEEEPNDFDDDIMRTTKPISEGSLTFIQKHILPDYRHRNPYVYVVKEDYLNVYSMASSNLYDIYTTEWSDNCKKHAGAACKTTSVASNYDTKQYLNENEFNFLDRDKLAPLFDLFRMIGTSETAEISDDKVLSFISKNMSQIVKLSDALPQVKSIYIITGLIELITAIKKCRMELNFLDQTIQRLLTYGVSSYCSNELGFSFSELLEASNDQGWEALRLNFKSDVESRKNPNEKCIMKSMVYIFASDEDDINLEQIMNKTDDEVFGNNVNKLNSKVFKRFNSWLISKLKSFAYILIQKYAAKAPEQEIENTTKPTYISEKRVLIFNVTTNDWEWIDERKNKTVTTQTLEKVEIDSTKFEASNVSNIYFCPISPDINYETYSEYTHTFEELDTFLRTNAVLPEELEQGKNNLREAFKIKKRMGFTWIRDDQVRADDIEKPFDSNVPKELTNMSLNQVITLETAYTPNNMTWKHVFYEPVFSDLHRPDKIIEKAFKNSKRWRCIPKEEDTYVCVESMKNENDIEVCRCKLLPSPKLLRNKRNFGLFYIFELLVKQLKSEETNNIVANLSAFFMSHYLKMLPKKPYDPNLYEANFNIPSDLKNGAPISVYEFLIRNRNNIFNESSKELQKIPTEFVNKYFANPTSFYFGLRYIPIICQPSFINGLFSFKCGYASEVLKPTSGAYLRVKPYTKKEKPQFTNVNYENQANVNEFIIMACKHLNERFDLSVKSDNYLNYLQDFFEWNPWLQTYIFTITPKTLKKTTDKLYNLMYIPIKTYDIPVVSKPLPLHAINDKDSSIHFRKVFVKIRESDESDESDEREYREGYIKCSHVNTTATDSLRRAFTLHGNRRFDFFDYEPHETLMRLKDQRSYTKNMTIEYWTSPVHDDVGDKKYNLWFRNLYRSTWYKFNEIQIDDNFTDYEDYTVIRFDNPNCECGILKMQAQETELTSETGKTIFSISFGSEMSNISDNKYITIERNTHNKLSDLHTKVYAANIEKKMLFITHPHKILLQVLRKTNLRDSVVSAVTDVTSTQSAAVTKDYKTFIPSVNTLQQLEEDVKFRTENQYSISEPTLDVFFEKNFYVTDCISNTVTATQGKRSYEIEKIDKKLVTVYKEELFRRDPWMYGLLRLLEHQSNRIMLIKSWNQAVSFANLIKKPGDLVNSFAKLFYRGSYGSFVCTTLDGDVTDCNKAIGKSDHYVTISLEQMHITTHDPLPVVKYGYLTQFDPDDGWFDAKRKDVYKNISNSVLDIWFVFTSSSSALVRMYRFSKNDWRESTCGTLSTTTGFIEKINQHQKLAFGFASGAGLLFSTAWYILSTVGIIKAGILVVLGNLFQVTTIYMVLASVGSSRRRY